MKKYLVIPIETFVLFSCSNNESNPIENPVADPLEESQASSFTDSFDTDGTLVNYISNNAAALSNVSSASGRYKAILEDNTDNRTLHFNNSQGRIDAKLVEFPFEFIARNIGIGTLDDSQLAPLPTNNPYIFCGIQVHVKDFNSINSAHVVVGHRGSTGYTIEGKNTVNGISNINDIGQNTVPQGRADIRIVGNDDNTILVYWQRPNLAYFTIADSWNLYRNTGSLPGAAPVYGNEVYIGLIIYAFGQEGIPFVGTCDAIQLSE